MAKRSHRAQFVVNQETEKQRKEKRENARLEAAYKAKKLAAAKLKHAQLWGDKPSVEELECSDLFL